jgi:hypothetical protein
LSALKWKASNLYSTTNSTETNSTSIIPTSAVTYALAQSINEMGGSGMLYFSSITFSDTYTKTSTSLFTFTGTIDIPDGCSKVCFIYKDITSTGCSSATISSISIDGNNITANINVKMTGMGIPSDISVTIYYLLQ